MKCLLSKFSVSSLQSFLKHSAFSVLFLTFAFASTSLIALADDNVTGGSLDLSTVTLDVSPVFTLAGIIIAAIASIWAIKKVIKLANRS